MRKRREDNPSVLGNLIAARRAELQQSQEEISIRAGMSQEWLGMLERGRIRQPRMDALQGLAKALDIPIEELIIAAGYSKTKADAQKLIPEEIEDPNLAAAFISLQKLSPERLQQAHAVIEGLSRLDDDEFLSNRTRRGQE